ncbi:MAG TPA: hypothetical protein VGD43_12690 [Micromonospora sp.]
MVGQVGTAAREILVVLALAFTGLLLALIAAFAPWYGAQSRPSPAGVVEMRAPSGPGDGADLTTAAEARQRDAR